MQRLFSQNVRCPYCGEYFEALIDGSQGDCQYTEDCYVCCRPIVFNCHTSENGAVAVTTHSEDESL